MNADNFSKIASGVQNIAVAIGLAIGAWWALQTFLFQNPAFYEQGTEVVGRTPTAVKVEIDVEPLDQITRSYEVRLTVTNSSKTLSQVVSAKGIDVVLFKPGETTVGHAKFFTSESNVSGLVIPTSESRVLRLFTQFPSDGIFYWR